MSSTVATKRENVWEYPRPPAIEPTSRRLRVVYNDNGNEIVLADTTKAFRCSLIYLQIGPSGLELTGIRILETNHPPTYYIPPKDVRLQYLTKSPRRTLCEWKGLASYYDFVPPSGSDIVNNRIWFYEDANGTEGKYKDLTGYLSFYVGPWRCFVDEEAVTAQPGDFYGGWLTNEIEGMVKGGPGTSDW